MSGDEKGIQRDRGSVSVRTGPAAGEEPRDRGSKTVRRPPNKMLGGDARRGYEVK